MATLLRDTQLADGADALLHQHAHGQPYAGMSYGARTDLVVVAVLEGVGTAELLPRPASVLIEVLVHLQLEGRVLSEPERFRAKCDRRSRVCLGLAIIQALACD